MQFVEKAAWFPEWGMSYFLGIDGISLLLVLLTTFLTILCVLVSWKSPYRPGSRNTSSPSSSWKRP